VSAVLSCNRGGGGLSCRDVFVGLSPTPLPLLSFECLTELVRGCMPRFEHDRTESTRRGWGVRRSEDAAEAKVFECHYALDSCCFSILSRPVVLSVMAKRHMAHVLSLVCASGVCCVLSRARRVVFTLSVPSLACVPAASV